MIGNEMFLLKRGCGALGLDEIAKDIKEKKDNAIAMEFTKCIGELLRKNGVLPKITEYTHENAKEKSIEYQYGVSIDELDFSEHDKVFEDKIAKLEKELEEWKEEARVVKKQRDEQLKSFRKGIEPYVDLLHMHETIAELKQRIVELESKEMEKPTKCTAVIVAKEINGQTYVTLDDFMSVVNDLQAEIGT